MSVMNIMDIYNFMSTYLTSSPEHLYIWLSQYNASDQLIFIKLFSTDKVKFISKYTLSALQYKNIHAINKCKCQKIFDALDDNFKKHVSLEHFFKCVELKNIDGNITEIPTIPLDSKKLYTFDKKRNENLIIEYVPIRVIKPYPNLSISGQPGNDTLLINEEKYLAHCTQKYLLNGKSNFSLPISIIFNRLQDLHLLLPYLNILELYTLYRIKYAFTLSDIERMLPEYWRSFRRSYYETKVLSPYDLLNSMYKYHNIEDIIQCNTNTKASFKLSKITDIKNYNEEYFQETSIVVQPNFCGFRVVICKTVDSGIFITNKHGIKVNVPCQINIKHDLMQETEAWYTGEFIIMAYDPIRKLWMHHNTFFYSDNQYGPQDCKLVLVDLFIWNGINLLTNSYDTRLKLMKYFVKTINHNNLILPIPSISNLSLLKNSYINELRDSKDGKPHFNGAVFKHKNANYQKLLRRKKFCITKCEIFTKYEISTLLVTPKKPGKICLKNQDMKLLITNNNYKYCITVVCYKHLGTNKHNNNKMVSNLLDLAIFDGLNYISWQKIRLDCAIKMTYRNQKIKIDHKNYHWSIINVGFNEFKNRKISVPIFKDIVMLENRPDKSLTDCATVRDLKRLDMR